MNRQKLGTSRAVDGSSAVIYTVSPSAIFLTIKKLSRVVGRMGFFARGIVYILVGGFFIQAAYQADPQEAGGLKEALDTIVQQSYGQYALMVVGAGIFLFGIFCAIESRYHKT